ncbi:unnamed protein product, partial [marine sediment metagenome]
EEVFGSILDNIEYVRNHSRWWDRDITGSITDVDTNSSYYVKVDQDCILTICGLRERLPRTITLTEGWNSVSYLYDRSKPAFDTHILSGIFREIIDHIIWIRGVKTREEDDNWCMPGRNNLTLGRGKGIFIKMRAACELVLPEEEE